MALRILEAVRGEGFVEIPEGFVQKWLSASACVNPLYVVVYLYALGCEEGMFSVADAADSLEVSRKSVFAALDHWRANGVIDYSYANGIARISYPNYGRHKPNQAKDEPKTISEEQQAVEVETIKEPVAEEQKLVEAVMCVRPDYTPQELEAYRNSTEVRILFDNAQEHLGRLLSYSDMNSIFSFYDWLRITPDVIDVLLRHCCEGGHTNMAYIERVALDWSTRGLDTPEKAESYLSMFSRDFKGIMKAFGIYGRNPSPTETEYMSAWINELNMPLELLLHACDQAVLNTGGISFAYADKIVRAWHAEGIDTIETAKAYNEAFKEASYAAEQVKPRRRKPAQKPQLSQNRFANFNQRDWNFDDIEKQALQNTLDEHGS